VCARVWKNGAIYYRCEKCNLYACKSCAKKDPKCRICKGKRMSCALFTFRAKRLSKLCLCMPHVYSNASGGVIRLSWHAHCSRPLSLSVPFDSLSRKISTQLGNETICLLSIRCVVKIMFISGLIRGILRV
jgi:hypothetical protein